MKPLELLELISKELEKDGVEYILCGGLAASLYRDKPRLTNDVDIAISLGTYEESKKFALSILNKVGAKTSLGWIPGLKDKNIKTMALVIGQFSKNDYDATIHILLPNLPWVSKAIQRGLHHKINYSFSKIPTITLEDLVLAKLFALSVEPSRFQDIDDLKSIFTHNSTIDLLYLDREMKKLEVHIPEILYEFVPKVLWSGKII